MAPVTLMVNGLPGNMAALIAGRVLADDRFEVIRQSLTGPEIRESTAEVEGKTFELIPPAKRQSAIEEILRQHATVMCVDFTHPSATNDNLIDRFSRTERAGNPSAY